MPLPPIVASLGLEPKWRLFRQDFPQFKKSQKIENLTKLKDFFRICILDNMKIYFFLGVRCTLKLLFAWTNFKERVLWEALPSRPFGTQVSTV